MSKLRRTVGTKNCKSNRFSTADYYTFPASIQKETSLEVPKCLHFIYIGKAIRDNYVENIRQNLNQNFSCWLKLFQLKIEGLCNKLKSKHIKIKIDQYFGWRSFAINTDYEVKLNFCMTWFYWTDSYFNEAIKVTFLDYSVDWWAFSGKTEIRKTVQTERHHRSSIS